MDDPHWISIWGPTRPQISKKMTQHLKLQIILNTFNFSLVCFMNDLACQYNPYSLILHGWLPGTGMSKSSKDLLTPEQSSVGEHLGDPPGWSLIIYQGKKVGHTISLTVMFCINYKWPSNRLPLTWKKDPLNAHNGSSLFQTLDFTLLAGASLRSAPLVTWWNRGRLYEVWEVYGDLRGS